MGTTRFTPEFKEEAVRQITERGYSVSEFFDRLDVIDSNIVLIRVPLCSRLTPASVCKLSRITSVLNHPTG